MASVDVVTVDNQKKGKVDLPASVFEVAIKPHLHHAEVRRQLAGRHRGTHSTKNRAAVSGGGAKPWRQKGTGRARQGTTRAPQWAGGGSVFGPVPRGYDHALPKKVRGGALRSALSEKLREGKLVCLDALEVSSHKTKDLTREVRGGLGIESKTLLLPLEEERNLALAARNNPDLHVVRALGVSIVDLLGHDTVVVSEDALKRLSEVLA